MLRSDFSLGEMNISGNIVPLVSTRWSFRDRIGAMKVRWALDRKAYKIMPGLYGVGSPDHDSRVYVTANYKLSFDHLRAALDGENGWILVLDTRGINVWCAGGKGSFGTDELVRRIQLINLASIVSHRKLILPQLGATGVAAYKVRELSGFHVIYGPVRASDIKTWLAQDMTAGPEMRHVRFNMYDRLILTGVEISAKLWYLVFAMATLFILSGLNAGGYSVDLAFHRGNSASYNLIAAFFCGTFLTPLLLPYIPFRAFSLKGGFMVLFLVLIMILSGIMAGPPFVLLAWTLMMTGISSYLAMNFTGSSTLTNLSGVLLEVKKAVPFQIGFAATGLVIYIVTLFLSK